MKFIAALLSTLWDSICILTLFIGKRVWAIDSATGYSDLHFLYLLARDGWGKGLIVEIGAFKGRSTCMLAWGSISADRESVISIDPHLEGTHDQFMANLMRNDITGQVNPIFRASQDARPQFDQLCAAKGLAAPCIRLMFIDGNHEYEFVKNDILLWKDAVIDGGVIAFHDYSWKGVRAALDECVKDNPEFTIEGTVGCTVFISKRHSRNKFLFRKMRLFDGAKRVFLRKGARKYGAQ